MKTQYSALSATTLMLILLILLSACGGVATPTVVPPTQTAIPPTPTIPATATPVVSTPTATAGVVFEDSPTGVVHLFLSLMQGEGATVVDEQFKAQYFTADFAANDFKEEGIGTLKDVTLSFNDPITIDENTAVVKVDAHKGESLGTLAVILEKQGTWKIGRLQNFSWPGFIHQLRELLSENTNRTAEEEWQLQDVNRYFLTEEEMILKYEQNRALFGSTARELLAQTQIDTVCRLGYNSYRINSEVADNETELEQALIKENTSREIFNHYTQAIDQLNVSCIETNNKDNVDFIQAGMLSQSKGYIYSTRTDVDLTKPALEYSSKKIIDDQWYLYI